MTPAGFTSVDLSVVLPAVLLAAGVVTVVGLNLLLSEGAFKGPALLAAALASLLASLVASWYQFSPAFLDPAQDALSPALARAWTIRPFTVAGTLVLQVIALLVLLMAPPWMGPREKRREGDAFALILLFCLGGVLAVSARDLILAFLGLEILSVSLYALGALRRDDPFALEAVRKHFLLGTFAAALFIYGASLIYAGTGSLVLPELGPVAREGLPVPTGLAAMGGGLLFAALFFKASVAPFHVWAPDVHQGAGTPVTALMAAGTKAAAFLVLAAVAPWIPREILVLVPFLALLTILAGNCGAMAAGDLKRMMAYVGIAHAGYLMVGYAALTLGKGVVDAGVAVRAILFYLAACSPALLGAFAAIAHLEKAAGGPITVAGLKGAAKSHPVAAVCLGLCTLSLAGLPPTAGFWGKYHVFSAAIQTGQHLLATAGILLVVVGLVPHLRVLASLCMTEEEGTQAAPRAGGSRAQDPQPVFSALSVAAMALPTGAVLLIGVAPGVLADAIIWIRL